MRTEYSTEEYVGAFQRLNPPAHQVRMLGIHYHAPDRTISATQMSNAMGYATFGGANLHYGKLGRLLGEMLGWHPDTAIYVLAEFEKPNREWFWIMRPQVAEAIEALGWVDGSRSILPEEITPSTGLFEGAVRKVSINAYERSSAARDKCILHHGCACASCGTLMADLYGEVAQGHVHVHHLVPLSEVGREYHVDPVRDLLPVCPNCHAVIHLKEPPYTIEEMKTFLKAKKGIANQAL
jgi:5-methylcytosine-specific restriction protein A